MSASQKLFDRASNQPGKSSSIKMTRCQIICNDVVVRQDTDQLSNLVYRLIIGFGLFPSQTGFMLRLLWLLPIISAQLFRPRRDLLLENMAFRHQLSVLSRRCFSAKNTDQLSNQGYKPDSNLRCRLGSAFGPTHIGIASATRSENRVQNNLQVQ